MTRPHKKIPYKVLYASALLQMRDKEGKLLISHEEAKLLTTEQIIGRYHPDHYPIPHAEGGPDLAWNIVPTLIPEHLEKTRTIDVPGIAKRKRVAESWAQHQAAMAAKAEPAERANAIKAAQMGLESENLDAVTDALLPFGKANTIPKKRKRERKGFGR